MFFPVASQQCFFIFICFFIVTGFMRGWCREIVSLVFILLAACLVHPDTSDALNCFLGRTGYAITYLGGASQQLPPTCNAVFGFLSGAFWSLLIFMFFVVVGYVIGNRVFPWPRFFIDRLFGIIPAIISGSFIIFYMSSFFRVVGFSTNFLVIIQQLSPAQFIPLVFIFVITSLILALFAACFRR